jgi:hypothetical protein
VQPTASDPHGSLILAIQNNLSHLQAHPDDFTSLLAHKGVGPTSTETTLWHQRLGQLGKDTMTFALRSADINRAKYDSHFPV